MYRVLAVIILLFLSLTAVAKDSKAALKDLVETLDRIETISGTFVQYSVDQRGVRIQESRGELKAERGGNFYWRTFEPLEQIVASNGEKVTVYDPDLEQATVQAMGAQVLTTPAVLFSGDTQKIGELFDVELSSFKEEVRQFSLKPKGQDSLFEKLKIRFRGQNVSELRITDALGQESTMSFIQTQVNLKLPKDAFVIDLPPGTDIIRDIQPPSNR